MLFTNEKWINLSHVFMLLIITRYVRKFRRERKEVGGKGRRIRETAARYRKKGGGFGKTSKSGQPLNDRERRAELFASK